ncbi:MAG: cysteine desulfurase family protein [Bacteriovoracaceae bacterium]
MYLDFNATSPLSQSVQNWLKSGEFHFANPSSQHSAGKASRKVINESREKIFKVFHKNEKDTRLFFHSGATEGISTIAHSFAEEARLCGRDLLICYSKIDHPAVNSLEENYLGPHVKFYEMKRGQDLFYSQEENYKAILDKKENNPDLIILVHHLWVHNETGHLSPLADLALLKKIPDLYVHVDAVQAPGKVETWRELTHGDIFTFSAHKFGALKGIGFSFLPKNLPLHPLLTGGGQQSNLRSGTENPMGVQSIALALDDLVKVDVKKLASLRERLVKEFSQRLQGIGEVITASPDKMNANTIYFYLSKLTSDVSLALFDLNGMMISAGSACQSGAAKDSEILLHLHKGNSAKNGLRLSFGFSFSEEDLNILNQKLDPIFNKLRAL